MDDVPPLRISYDANVDAAYLYLQSVAVVQPSVARTEAFDSTINLDFDAQGRLVGIEVLAARTLLRPELLDGSTG
jgi:YD repeat-containing protein